MKLNRKSAFGAGIALLLATAAGTIQAGIIHIYDGVGAGDLRSDWETAVGSFMEDDFTGGITGDFTITTSGSGHTSSSNDAFDTVGDLSDRLLSTTTTTITFEYGVTAFGANWDLGPGGQGLGIKLLVDGVALAMEIPPSYTGEFFGFTSDTAFTTVTLTGGSHLANAETYNADNFVYVPAAGSVPEPATFALFGLGLAGLGFARRRRAG